MVSDGLAAKAALANELSPLEAEALTVMGGLRKGTAARDTVWPGTDIAIRMEVISDSDVQSSVAAAFRRFLSIGLPLPKDDITIAPDFENEVMLQVLWRACRDPRDRTRPAAASADAMRDVTTVAQRVAAYRVYRDLENEVDPDAETLTEELRDAILDAIKKKDAARLRAYGSRTLSSFLLSGAVPPWTAPTGSSPSSSSG